MLVEEFTEVRKYLACVASSEISPGGKAVYKIRTPQAKLKGALKQAKVFPSILLLGAEGEDEFFKAIHISAAPSLRDCSSAY